MQNLTPGRPTGFHRQNSRLGRNDSMLTRHIHTAGLITMKSPSQLLSDKMGSIETTFSADFYFGF